MNIKTIIVDDEQQNLDLMKHFLNVYCTDVKVVGVARDVETAVNLITIQKPNIVFLDILLGNTNGFKILDKINDPSIYIIFTTAYNEFALKAFKYNTADYLMKPIRIDELINAVEKVKLRIDAIEVSESQSQKPNVSEMHVQNFLAVTLQNGISIIPYDEIMFLKVFRKNTTIYLLDGSEIFQNKPLFEFEEKLNPSFFLRIHNSYIVNMKCIDRVINDVSYSCVLKSGVIIPVSRRKQKDVKKWLNL